MSLDPTQPPSLNVALTLAQAALQRQTQLLQALDNPSTGHAAAPADKPMSTEAGNTPNPGTASSSVQLSDPARAQLAQAATALPSWPTAASSKSAPAGLPAWPVTAPDEATQTLIETLLQAAPPKGFAPASVRSMQPWPPALVQHLLNANTEQPTAATPSSGWQTWPFPASVLQTAVGRQTLQATLVLPGAVSLASNAPTDNVEQSTMSAAETAARPGLGHIGAAQPSAPRLLLMPQQTSPLTSAWYALLLETDAGEQQSALLALEFGAPQTATLYGRDLFTPRTDPWLQQAVLLASGHVPRVARQTGEKNTTCQTADCPYQGRAACPQPFCPDALRIRPVP